MVGGGWKEGGEDVRQETGDADGIGRETGDKRHEWGGRETLDPSASHVSRLLSLPSASLVSCLMSLPLSLLQFHSYRNRDDAAGRTRGGSAEGPG